MNHEFRRTTTILKICVYLCASAATLSSQSEPGSLLSNGWRIQPAGTQIPLDTLPLSTALSHDGKFLLVLNGGADAPSISVLAVESMRELARVPVADAWLGLCFSPDGSRVYAGGGSRYSVSEFSFSAGGQLKPVREIEIAPKAKPGADDFIGDVAVSPDGQTLYAADLYHDRIVTIDARTGRVTGKFMTGRRPYRILVHPDGKSLFVSSWAEGAVFWHETRTGAEITRLRLGPHPTGMILNDRKTAGGAWRYRLFVAVANTNTVFVAGVSDQNTMQVIETLKVGMTESQPAGSTPSALALSLDQMRLFVVCSDINVVAVVDISEDRSRVEGFIPTGRYPTAARMLAGGRLAILNGRGVPPQDTGSMSVIDPLTDESIAFYAKTAASLSPYRDDQLDVALEKPSPIRHVIYVIKGDRSYSQIFSTPGAAPNHSKLAREFLSFDNYYLAGASEPEGQNWALAGIAPDYTERLWPNVSAHRSGYSRFEGGELANSPPAGYLWSNALGADLSVRNYGEFVENRAQPGSDGIQVARFNDPSLPPITNTRFRGADPSYPDTERVRVFLDDLKQFESSGDLPRLMLVRLSNDRSAAGLADNDQALGMLVEGVSHSRFWPSAAIFVTENNAPEGLPSALLVASPFTHLGAVDHNFYNQSSVLRTMELILGLRPMTVFDAAARPIGAALTGSPVATPFTAVHP